MEQEHTYPFFGSQVSPPWNLDRVDQHAASLDGLYTYGSTAGQGVHVYVIDTRVRVDHVEFGSRAEPGYDFIDDDLGATDPCVGHGTHVLQHGADGAGRRHLDAPPSSPAGT